MWKHKGNGKYNKILIILIALTAFSVLIISLSIGKPKNSIWPFYLELDNPISCYTQNEDGPDKGTQVVIDQHGKRVSLINSSNNVYSQIFFDSNNNILSYAQRAIIYNNELYLYGYKTNESTAITEGIKIVKYSLNGKYLEEIYKYDYDYANEDYLFVYNMEIVDNSLYLIMSAWNNLYIKIIDTNDIKINHLYEYKLRSELFTTVWDYDNKALIIIDNLNHTYKIDFNNPAGNKSKLMTISDNYTIENKNPYYKIQFELDSNINNIVKFTNTSNTDVFHPLPASINWDLSKSKAYLCENNANHIINYDFCSDTYEKRTSFNYEPSVLLFTIAYWICVFYMIILIIALIIMWLINIRKKDKERFFKISIGLSILLATTLTFVFVFSKFYDWNKQNFEKNAESIAQIVSHTDKLNLENFNYSSITTNSDNAKECINLISDLEHICGSQQNITGQNYNYEIFGYNNKTNEFQNIAHMTSYIGTYGLTLLENNKKLLFDNEMIKGYDDSKIFETYEIIAPLYNYNDKIVGAVAISVSCESMFIASNDMFFEISIIAILAIISVFLILKEWSNLKTSIKNYKKAKKINFHHAEVYFSATMEFFKNYFVSIDNVLCVLITKDMLDIIGQGTNGVLLGLPISLFGFGSFFGSLFFPILAKKMNIKPVYILGSIGVTLTLLITAITVFFSNYYLFCLSKLLFGIFYSIIYVANHTLPMCVDDEEIRFNAVRNITLTDVSAPIISVMISAFIASIFGNYMIYIAGTISSLAIFITSIFFMPNKLKFKGTNPANKQNINIKTKIKFFMDPAILCIALLCIVSLCVGAYKSYLFPLYTNGLNLSNTEISNYFVIASALVFVFSPSLDAITKKINHWNNVISFLVVLFIVFSIFYINSTIIWAIVAFFLSTIVQKSLNAELKLLWPRKCARKFIDPALIQPIFTSIDSFGLCIRPIILGTFLIFGAGNACVTLGFVCLLSAVLLFISSRNSSIRKPID